MDVTRENFAEVLPAVKAAVESCDFVAIDLEMAGLHASSDQQPRFMDSMQQRWESTRDAATKLAVLQFGVCAFKWEKPPSDADEQLEEEDAEEKLLNNHEKPDRTWSLKATPFNFYIFPQHAEGMTEDVRLLMQCSSIAFLSSQGFDFNKTFGHGISYMDDAASKKAYENLEARFAEKLASQNTTVSNESGSKSKPALKLSDINNEGLRNAVKRAIAEASTLNAYVTNPEPDAPDMYKRDAQDQPYVVLEKLNAFCRRCLYEEIPRMYPSIHVGKFQEDNPPGKQRFEALRLTYTKSATQAAETERERLQESMAKDRAIVEANVGFSNVIKFIRDAQKPVVAHNCFLDMAHTFAKFIAKPPLAVEDYRAQLHEAFPIVVDTKFMFQTNDLLSSLVSNTQLGEAFKITEESRPFMATNPNVTLATGFERYAGAGEEFHHEAGYDAYMTGIIFGRAWTALGLPVNPQFSARVDVNEICLANSDGRFRLDSPIEEIDRSLVVRLCNFPPSTKSHHLQNVIKKALGVSYVRVIWETDTSAYYKAASNTARNTLISANASARKNASVSKSEGDDSFEMSDLEILPYVAASESLGQKRPRDDQEIVSSPSPDGKRSRTEDYSSSGKTCQIM